MPGTLEEKPPGMAPSNKRERVIQLVILALILLIWETAGRIVGPFFLAAPSAMISGAVQLFGTPEFWKAVYESMLSFIAGFSLAAVTGVAIGYLMGWYKPVAMIFNPFLSAFYVMPIAALVPVMIIWFGIGFTPRVMAVLLFSIFEIIISVYTGVRNVDQTLIEVATSFGANRWQLFRRVVFYNALPYVFAGLRIGSGRAVKGMIIAELLFAVTGMGGLIMTYSNYYRIDMVFVLVATVSIIGVIIGEIIMGTERVLAPWKE
jgi:NitT/TauT family transport system permease protein